MHTKKHFSFLISGKFLIKGEVGKISLKNNQLLLEKELNCVLSHGNGGNLLKGKILKSSAAHAAASEPRVDWRNLRVE